MPSLDSPAILVARFLRANDYHETLEAFLREADLPPDAGSTSKGDVTIEQILQEKKVFDATLAFEKLGLDEEEKKWTTPAPSVPTTLRSLPTTSNILSVSLEPVITDSTPTRRSLLFASTADRRLNLIVPSSTPSILDSLNSIQDSPMLSFTTMQGRYLLGGSMSGKILLYDLQSKSVILERRDHAKYVVKIVTCEEGEVTWIATAGWDAKVLLYRVRKSENGTIEIGEPVAMATQLTNPEAMAFVVQDGAASPTLLVTRRDSTFIYYYELPAADLEPSGSQPADLVLKGKQNLAPHSNAWIAFTPCAMALSPKDPSLLAVATSAIPHMKLILVRLLFPGAETLQTGSSSQTNTASLLDSFDSTTSTPAAYARAALALQDREAAAIQIHCTTMAPQTQYSTPALAWRPDGSGVWVNSDDGMVRGIEVSTGKVVSVLEGHEVGSKIRCLWAGVVELDESESESESHTTKTEWLVSGGFDQRLVVWRVE